MKGLSNYETTSASLPMHVNVSNALRKEIRKTSRDEPSDERAFG